MARTNKAERKTTVKGIWANANTQEFNQFEVVTEYTRSTEKAVKLASEILNPDNDPAIMVSVSELIQEKAARKYYDNAAMYLTARQTCMTEEEAKEQCNEDETIVKGFFYTYHTCVFYFNTIENEYAVTPFTWTSGANSTARDCRAMLAMRFEEIYGGCKVIDMHEWGTSKGYTKTQDTAWFILTPEQLERCLKKETKDES